MPEAMKKCVGCGEPGRFSVVLAIGPQGHADLHIPRYYIPNQNVRRAGDEGFPRTTEEVPFCEKCMRAIENNLRATILGIQADNDLLSVSHKNPN